MRVVEAVVRRLAVGLAVAMLGLGAMLWAALAVAGQAAAETRAALTESRVALVVGNSAYQHTAALTNPLNDARDLAAALQRTGFEVIVATDADKRQMDAALRAFAEKLGSADVALFFYAGHGLQVGNENYLVPVDAQLASQRDLEFEAVKLDFVLRQMEIDRDGKTTIAKAIKSVVLCAQDPVGAWGAKQMLSERYHLGVDVISGRVTDGPTGTRFCLEQLGVPACNALRDGPELANAVLASLGTQLRPEVITAGGPRA